MKMAHHQWKRFLSCMPAAADGKHGGDLGLAAQASATRESRPNKLSPQLKGDRGPFGLYPLHQSTLNCNHKPILCSRNQQSSACGGIRLTEMSDTGSFVGRFRSLLLPIADNACAAPIPGQTTRQRVLRVRPAEADQDL